MSEEQRRQLQQQLWKIADDLRGKMHADEFRDYMLGFIFYKYLSEKMQRYADELLSQDGRLFSSLNERDETDALMIAAAKIHALDELGYFLKPTELFHAVALKGSHQSEKEGENFVIPDLTEIFGNIERSTQGTESADEFVNLFEDLDLTSSKLGNSPKAKNELVAKILIHLDKIDFQLQDVNADVLGDAYEYLIGEFASGAGKKAGEFYTPQPVSTLLAKLVTCQNKTFKNVYDPTCGSGSLLLRVKKEAGQERPIEIYGQELNRTTFNLARMNMIMHGVHYNVCHLKQEDTLTHPQHLGTCFDAIVANPPFSANWNADPSLLSDDRFGVYGVLAPKTKADMAFLQHMLHHLADGGVMACVLPHGVLFRGGAEGHIRKYFIDNLNALDAVIGLPANIFYGTSIPTCVLVFKKCRKQSENILFVDASKHFEKVKTQNKLLPEHIEKVVAAYVARSDEAKFSRVVPLSEIVANDYNLNIPRYVDTFEAEISIDLDEVAADLRALAIRGEETDARITVFCQELGIQPPF
ncbi:MAG: type I restriction-modification system subunit M [Thiotrichaceae bacterium]|nr:type I restriction-modification system subunit M [Thiotrichaceae bacterium]